MTNNTPQHPLSPLIVIIGFRDHVSIQNIPAASSNNLLAIPAFIAVFLILETESNTLRDCLIIFRDITDFEGRVDVIFSAIKMYVHSLKRSPRNNVRS